MNEGVTLIHALKKMHNHSVFKNTISLFILQLTNVIAPLIVLPYLSRVLGINGFGLVMLAFSASSIGLVVTDFGFNLSATYSISKNRDKIDYISELIGSIFIIKMFLTLIVVLSTVAYNRIFGANSINLNLIFYISFNLLCQSLQPTFFFQGIEKMKNVTIYLVTAKFSYVLMVLVFIKNKEDAENVILLFAISNAIAAMIAIKAIYSNGYKVKKPSFKIAVRTFKESSQFFLSRASVSIYTAASTFLVGLFSGIQQAAIYGASEKLYQASQSVTSPLSQALFPYMARHQNEKLLLKVIFVVSIPLLITCVIIGFWAQDLMSFIFGREFYQGGEILKIFIIITVITFISINFGYPAFAAIGKLNIVNYTVFLGAFIQLTLLSILYLNSSIGALAVVKSVLVTELVVAIARVTLFMRFRK